MTLSKREVEKIISSKGANLVSVLYIDLGSVHRAKAHSISDLDQVLRSGTRFAKGNLGMTTRDSFNPHSKYSVASGEVMLVPDLSTFAIADYAPKLAKFIGDLRELNGKPWSLCTRRPLRDALRMVEREGFRYMGGGEIEFHVVRREADEIVSFDSGPVQSQHGLEISQDIFQEFITSLESASIKISKIHVEGGGGETGHMEVDLRPAEGMRSADELVMAKDVLKGVSKRMGYICSFMPKISPTHTGSGMHIHSSLWKPGENENVFYDPDDDRGYNLSKTAYHFIGGLLAHARALTALACPTVNSYKRLLPGRWNSDGVFWSFGSRAAAVRVPEGSAMKSARVELRIPDASANPYLVTAGMIAAGMDGVKRRIDPGDPVNYDVSSEGEIGLREAKIGLLPGSLREALDEFENDRMLNRALGEELSEEFLKNRRFHWAEYSDKVTKWEVDNLLEM